MHVFLKKRFGTNIVNKKGMILTALVQFFVQILYALVAWKPKKKNPILVI